MSDLNPLETQLRSWTPRQPSPDLKERIFAREQQRSEPTRPTRRATVPTVSWLVPVAACCLTLFTLLGANADHTARPDGRADHAIFAVAMTSLTSSNPTATLPNKWFGLTATDENLEWNVWSRASFDWTKEGQFLSTNRSLQVARTNYLMR